MALWLLSGVCPGAASAAAVLDLADPRNKDLWLHHPAIGDPSYDTFVREPGNPIHIGGGAYTWPVNGFLFNDPVSKRWFAYPSIYPRGYWPPPSANSLILAESAALPVSSNGGASWQNLGMVFQGEPPSYVGSGTNHGAMTDLSVAYSDGKYHALYGWCDVANKRGGLGYAWSLRPEGPFQCAAKPVHDDAQQKPILGRYVRAYASTLFKRKHDWLIVHMMSTPGNSGGTWGLFAMTAAAPEGSYSSPQPLVLPQSDIFHPPIAEFFPAFVYRGEVFAPATSVARNRSFQVLFKAPVERAHEPDAWRIAQYGSLWHGEEGPEEFHGIWGQTFSGQVTGDGRLRVLFPGRTKEDLGTISMASRSWSKPFQHGFVLSAALGPSYAVLRQVRTEFDFHLRARANGPWAVAWDCRGPLGPDQASADSTAHPRQRTDRVEWRRAGEQWSLGRLRTDGAWVEIARGTQPGTAAAVPAMAAAVGSASASIARAEEENIRFIRAGGNLRILIDGKPVFDRALGETEASGRLELVAEPHTILRVFEATLGGNKPPLTGWESWLATEALAGAAVTSADWERRDDPNLSLFRFGTGYLSTTNATTMNSEARAKWNFFGRAFSLYAPKGPELGSCRVLLDGKVLADLDLHADAWVPSTSVLAREISPGPHALIITPSPGQRTQSGRWRTRIPCDSLDVLP